MTTFHTFDIDSVPPPSDYELARPLTVTRLLDVVVTPEPICFNNATRLLNITRDRGRFHAWLERNEYDPGEGRSEDEWWEHYDHFVQWEDARDLLNTQACALI